MVFRGFLRPLLNHRKLKDGVSRIHQNDGRGLASIEHACFFMIGKYVDNMIVYRRPMKDYQDFKKSK